MRHRNHGLRKRCRCKRKDWPKCPHGWQLNYKLKWGAQYRLSLDREAGRHIDSKTEAIEEAERIRITIRNGTFRVAAESERRETSAEAVTLEKCARQEWLPSAELNLKASTVKFYRDHLENHVFPLLGQNPLASVNRKDCRQLVASAREKGLRIQTVRGIVRTLSVVLSQAVEDEQLAANPALSMRKYLRRGDEPEPCIDPFTREEAAHVVEIARQHFQEWHPWLLCGLRTGLRAGELLALHGATSTGAAGLSKCGATWCAGS